MDNERKKEDEMSIGVEILPVVTGRKDASKIFERSLIEIIKANGFIDYQASITKRTYFDIVDTLMHMIRGAASARPADEPFFIDSAMIKASANIMNEYYQKRITLDDAIEQAFNAGYIFASIDVGPFA